MQEQDVPSQSMDAEKDSDVRSVSTLSFLSSGVRYVVEAEYVYEVLTGKGLTPVPNSPQHLLGITELRGHLLPVFDLATIGGRAEGFILGRTHVILFGKEKSEFGLLADCLPDIECHRLDTIPDTGESAVTGKAKWAQSMSGGAIFLEGSKMMHDPLFMVE